MTNPDPVAAARARGFELGRKNRHTTSDEWRTKAEALAWLEGHRAGYAEYLAEFNAMLRGIFGAIPIAATKKPTASERRAEYIERKAS